MTNFGIFLFLTLPTSCLPIYQNSAVDKSLLSDRQVGDGVNGNQTNSSGSITNSGGPGDGNGVGFAGTGNDIDTGMCYVLLNTSAPMNLPWTRVQDKIRTKANGYLQGMTSILAMGTIRSATEM